MASANSDIRCDVYGALGGSMADLMLPLTMKEMIGVMQGTEPEITNRIASGLLDRLTGEETLALVKMGDETSGVMGEMAGSQAIELLMTAQASTPDQVKSILANSCERIGFEKLIETQNQINAMSRQMQ